MGCAPGQGYLYSRPVPPEELLRLLTLARPLSAPSTTSSGARVARLRQQAPISARIRSRLIPELNPSPQRHPATHTRPPLRQVTAASSSSDRRRRPLTVRLTSRGRDPHRTEVGLDDRCLHGIPGGAAAPDIPVELVARTDAMGQRPTLVVVRTALADDVSGLHGPKHRSKDWSDSVEPTVSSRNLHQDIRLRCVAPESPDELGIVRRMPPSKGGRSRGSCPVCKRAATQ
jgi:hypothetical protein